MIKKYGTKKHQDQKKVYMSIMQYINKNMFCVSEKKKEIFLT